MHVCIPVTEDRGLASPVCAHFGSAPVFMLVDTETLVCRALRNPNADRAQGACQPLAALAGERVEGIVLLWIGAEALGPLEAAGTQVFLAEHPTVELSVAALRAGKLHRVTLEVPSGHRAAGLRDRSGCRPQDG